MKKRLVIWGASGHASVIVDIIRLRNEFEVVGFIDDVNPNRQGKIFCGSPILGGQEQLNVLKDLDVENLILGFGDCQARLKLAEKVHKKGFKLASAIHPSAVIAKGVEIGAGTVIAAGAVINPGSRIGANVIVNTCASVDHDCVIEDGVHICPGTHLAGYVTVERGAWVGIGATVLDRIRIGAGAMVGAGAVVVNDIPGGGVAYGVPARTVKYL